MTRYALGRCIDRPPFATQREIDDGWRKIALLINQFPYL